MWLFNASRSLARKEILKKTVEILKNKYMWSEEKIKSFEREISMIVDGTWWYSEDSEIEQIKEAALEAVSDLVRPHLIKECRFIL